MERRPWRSEQVPGEQVLIVASSAADRAAVVANLASFRPIAIARPDLRAASVAVCVLLQRDVPCLLITRRAAGLRYSAGQALGGCGRFILSELEAITGQAGAVARTRTRDGRPSGRRSRGKHPTCTTIGTIAPHGDPH